VAFFFFSLPALARLLRFSSPPLSFPIWNQVLFSSFLISADVLSPFPLSFQRVPRVIPRAPFPFFSTSSDQMQSQPEGLFFFFFFPLSGSINDGGEPYLFPFTVADG